MYFSTKRDLWLGLLLWVPIILGFVPILWLVFRDNGPFYVVLLLLLTVVFIAWIWFGTGYWVTEEELRVSCGLTRKTIPLNKIISLTASKDATSSPALSLDRIEVRYGMDDRILISPKDKEGLVKLIVEKCPQVTVKL